MQMTNNIQTMLNSCLRKTIVFDFKGKLFTASLNLTLNHMNSLRCSCNNVSERDFIKIENFENASEKGLLNFQVTNTGKLTADFFIFYECSDFILPINSDAQIGQAW